MSVQCMCSCGTSGGNKHKHSQLAPNRSCRRCKASETLQIRLQEPVLQLLAPRSAQLQVPAAAPGCSASALLLPCSSACVKIGFWTLILLCRLSSAVMARRSRHGPLSVDSNTKQGRHVLPRHRLWLNVRM
jgi:hypothetical protein